ncbi:unnamed protein product [Arabidopsis halleri]
MTPFLRSVVAQCCYRGGRSIRSRQAARDFSSLHASVFVGNNVPVLEERERQDLALLEKISQQNIILQLSLLQLAKAVW